MASHTRPRTWIRVARRACQLLVLAALFVIPTLGRYQALRNQSDQVGIERELGPRVLDMALKDMRNPEPITAALRGSVWTLRAGTVVISDPLAGADFAAASGAWLDPFLLTILVPVVLTLLLGRMFCGWVCPADLLFELGTHLRRFARVDTDVHFSRRTKYAVLLVGLAISAYLGSQTMAEIYPPRLVSGEIYGWIWYHRFGLGAWFLLAIVAFEVFVSERFWCRYACPGGALYTMLSRWRVVRLQVDRPACDGCRECEWVCEFGLKPEAKDVGPECNNCGECLPVCHTGALSIGPKRMSV